jgi:hypothetical protein
MRSKTIQVEGTHAVRVLLLNHLVSTDGSKGIKTCTSNNSGSTPTVFDLRARVCPESGVRKAPVMSRINACLRVHARNVMALREC